MLSCLCDWCTLKNTCGPSEYAQPPYFYLPSVGVVTTDVLSKEKPRLDLVKESLGSCVDSTNNDDDIENVRVHIITPVYHRMSLWLCVSSVRPNTRYSKFSHQTTPDLNVNPNSEDKCRKEYCRLGCICDSLSPVRGGQKVYD